MLKKSHNDHVDLQLFALGSISDIAVRASLSFMVSICAPGSLAQESKKEPKVQKIAKKMVGSLGDIAKLMEKHLGTEAKVQKQFQDRLNSLFGHVSALMSLMHSLWTAGPPSEDILPPPKSLATLETELETLEAKVTHRRPLA